MSKYIGENMKIIPLTLNTSTTTEVRSQAVSLRGVERVTVVCGYGLDLNVLDSAAHAESSLAHTATYQVYVGDATQNPASFAAMTSATCVLGMATVGEINNCQEIQIQVIGSWATGSNLTIGYGNTTKTYSMHTNASLADDQLSASDSTEFADALASAIRRDFPGLELVAGTTVGSGDTKAWTGILKEKVQGNGLINALVTGQAASTSAIGNVNIFRQVGLIEFTPAQVLATNSCYTQFAVGIDSSSTVSKMTAYAVLETGYKAVAGKRIRPVG
jgi:hypothetical protein